MSGSRWEIARPGYLRIASIFVHLEIKTAEIRRRVAARVLHGVWVNFPDIKGSGVNDM